MAETICTLTLAATLDSLAPLRQAVREASARAGLTPQATYKLQLAVDELATNAVSYGYPPNASEPQLRLTASLTTEALTILLEDDGTPFDPTTAQPVSETLLQQPVTEREVGGLGIFLALRGVDELRYERRGASNCNSLLVRLPRP